MAIKTHLGKTEEGEGETGVQSRISDPGSPIIDMAKYIVGFPPGIIITRSGLISLL